LLGDGPSVPDTLGVTPPLSRLFHRSSTRT
jgi:hypothetical protein